MQKRILRELTKTFPEHVKNDELDYTLSVNQTIGNKSNHINNITLESKKYRCKITMHLKDEYPFKPPSLTLNNTNTSYSYWCSVILHSQDNYKIFMSYVLSIISMKVTTGINKFVPNNKICLCCESLICGNRWSPGIHIFMVFNEFVFNSNLKKYLNPLYEKYFNMIFRNDRWNIPDDIILHIISYL